VVLKGSPQIIQVTFQVSGYSVSGGVAACDGPLPICDTSQGLGGATVSLVNSGGTAVATVTADSSGNFTFTNISPGTYTVNATGSVNMLSYSGTATVTVNGTVTSITVSAFSS
jgi:PKD repeat protein